MRFLMNSSSDGSLSYSRFESFAGFCAAAGSHLAVSAANIGVPLSWYMFPTPACAGRKMAVSMRRSIMICSPDFPNSMRSCGHGEALRVWTKWLG